MKKERKDLGFMALIAGSGAVGVLATLFAVVVTRGPARRTRVGRYAPAPASRSFRSS